MDSITRTTRLMRSQGARGAGYDDSDYAVKLSRSVPVLTDEPQ